MKKITIIVLALFSVMGFSQGRLGVVEAPITMSRGIQPSFQLDITETTLKEVKKNWLKYLGHGNSRKETEINGEILQLEVNNPNILAQPFRIYSKILETTEFVRLTVWVTQNDTLFYSTANNNDIGLAIKKYMHDFGIQEYKSAVGENLKLEEKKQKDLEDELAKFVKDEEMAWTKIGDYQRSIVKANDENTSYTLDIKNTNQKITDQNNMINKTASDPNATKGAKKTLKELKSEKANLQKKIKKNGEDIDDWNRDIRNEERNMAGFVELQRAKIVDIAIQKEKVLLVKSKYDGIE